MGKTREIIIKYLEKQLSILNMIGKFRIKYSLETEKESEDLERNKEFIKGLIETENIQPDLSQEKEVVTKEKEEYRTGGIIEEEMVYFIERTKYANPDTPRDKKQYTVVGQPHDLPGTLKQWGLWASENHKIVVVQKRKEVVPKEYLRLAQAEAQLLGFNHAREGYELFSLICAMGLTKEEWVKLQEEYELNYLLKEDKQIIQKEVNKSWD